MIERQCVVGSISKPFVNIAESRKIFSYHFQVKVTRGTIGINYLNENPFLNSDGEVDEASNSSGGSLIQR
jgi:hypothetical protein